MFGEQYKKPPFSHIFENPWKFYLTLQAHF
jgi:hypothetical protein